MNDFLYINAGCLKGGCKGLDVVFCSLYTRQCYKISLDIHEWMGRGNLQNPE